MRSAPSCLTFAPVRAIASPLLKLTPMSARKDSGQRYTSRVSVPFFTSKWTGSFSLPFGGNFTSSTVPFIFVSVRGSYLGGLVSVFCGVIGATPRGTRDTARNRILLEQLDGPDSPASRMAPPCHGGVIECTPEVPPEP